MAKAAAKREERAQAMASAGKRAAESGFDRPALKVPPNTQRWNPKPGNYTIDIIPYTVSKRIAKFAKKNFAQPGQLYYERTYFSHPKIGPSNDTHTCVAATFNLPCPVCEHRMMISKVATTPKKEKDALFPKERQLFYVFVHEEKEKGIQLWEIANWNFGKQLDSKINNARAELKPLYDTFYNPTAGYSLRIVGASEAMGDGGSYTKFSVDEMMPRKTGLDPKLRAMMPKLVPLEEIPIGMEYDAYRRLFLMIGEDEELPAGDEPGTDADATGYTEPDAETPAAAEGEGEEVEIEVGMLVEFNYKGEAFQGTVEAINEAKGLVKVAIEGREQPAVVKIDELAAVTEDAEAETPAAEDDGWGDGGDTATDDAPLETPAEDDGWGTSEAPPAPVANGKPKTGKSKAKK